MPSLLEIARSCAAVRHTESRIPCCAWRAESRVDEAVRGSVRESRGKGARQARAYCHILHACLHGAHGGSRVTVRLMRAGVAAGWGGAAGRQLSEKACCIRGGWT